MCGGEMDSWEHVLDRCVDGGEEGQGVGERIREILDPGGGAINVNTYITWNNIVSNDFSFLLFLLCRSA